MDPSEHHEGVNEEKLRRPTLVDEKQLGLQVAQSSQCEAASDARDGRCLALTGLRHLQTQLLFVY